MPNEYEYLTLIARTLWRSFCGELNFRERVRVNKSRGRVYSALALHKIIITISCALDFILLIARKYVQALDKMKFGNVAAVVSLGNSSPSISRKYLWLDVLFAKRSTTSKKYSLININKFYIYNLPCEEKTITKELPTYFHVK